MQTAQHSHVGYRPPTLRRQPPPQILHDQTGRTGRARIRKSKLARPARNAAESMESRSTFDRYNEHADRIYRRASHIQGDFMVSMQVPCSRKSRPSSKPGLTTTGSLVRTSSCSRPSTSTSVGYRLGFSGWRRHQTRVPDEPARVFPAAHRVRQLREPGDRAVDAARPGARDAEGARRCARPAGRTVPE